MRKLKRQSYKGFSLIELLTVLAIAGIMVTLTPSMIGLVHSNQSTTQIHAFTTSLNLARSEAIKRGNPVTLCRTLGNARCEGLPDINGQKAWHTGWMVFSDMDGNGRYNAPQDQIIRQHGSLPANYRLYSNARVRVTYQPMGISPGFMDTWTLCGPGGKPAYTRGVILAYSGRVRFAQDSNHDGTRDTGTAHNNGQVRELACND